MTGDQWALAMRGALVIVLALTLLRPTLPRWVDRLNVAFRTPAGHYKSAIKMLPPSI